MAIEIQQNPTNISPGQTVTFTIVSGVSSCLYAYFEWYVNDVLTGTGNEFSYIFNSGSTVYLKVNEYCETFWHGGQFYGGIFRGSFSGGAFHYGDLNGCIYNELSKKPKPFIINITGSGLKK